jgi:hypothetical protein
MRYRYHVSVKLLCEMKCKVGAVEVEPHSFLAPTLDERIQLHLNSAEMPHDIH